MVGLVTGIGSRVHIFIVLRPYDLCKNIIFFIYKMNETGYCLQGLSLVGIFFELVEAINEFALEVDLLRCGEALTGPAGGDAVLKFNNLAAEIICDGGWGNYGRFPEFMP